MNWQSALHRIDDHEDGLIAHFLAHPVLAGMAGMSPANIVDILLQRRFLSLAFAPFYDMGLDGLGDDASRACVREILREEYGVGAQPTHREDLVQDLVVLGATRDQILSTGASPATIQVIARLLGATQKQEDEGLYQIKLLTTLRLAGEVLVATEYEQLWPHLQRLGLSARREPVGTQSVFFYAHMCHDARKRRLGGEWSHLNLATHSDQMTYFLKSRLLKGPPEGVEYCIRAAGLTQEIKRSFYDQFLT